MSDAPKEYDPLLQAYCEVNTWRWPKVFGEEPSWWAEEEEIQKAKRMRTRELFRIVKHLAWLVRGEKAVSRYWNVVYEETRSMTDEKFEAWWEKHHAEGA